LGRNVAATRAQWPSASLNLVHSDFRSTAMAIIETGTHQFDVLRDRLRGHVVPSDDPRYDEARLAWARAHEQHPAAIAYPADASDVVEIVDFARNAGLQVTAQGTGHNSGAHGDRLAESILVKTSELREVSVDAEARIARVGAGALWEDVVPVAAEHGLAALVGSSPDVGVVGYSLGGGIGYLGRKHGIATNAVTAIEIVTADGRLRRVDADHDADLFWALRGGGGNYGVVTAMEFRVFPVDELYAGMLLWPVEDAARVYKAWRDWTETAPDEVTSMARMIKFPPFPDVPEPLQGRHMMVVSAAFLGSAEAGAELLQPLRELGPEMDMFGPMPPEGLMRLHGDPEEPSAFASDHALIDELPDEAIDALVAQAGAGSESPLMIVELRQLGGALGRTPEGAGALDRIEGKFLAFTGALTIEPGSFEPAACAAREAMALLAPYSHGRTYLNFAERVTNTRSAYSVATHQRLQAVKEAVDGEGVFHGNHRIEPAA
jgi:FAD/FMN-containing dehydrogenase